MSRATRWESGKSVDQDSTDKGDEDTAYHQEMPNVFDLHG